VKVANNGSRSSARNTAVVGNKTLTELVLDIKNLLTVFRLTWCHVPRNMCAELTALPSGECWNGVTTERYLELFFFIITPLALSLFLSFKVTVNSLRK